MVAGLDTNQIYTLGGQFTGFLSGLKSGLHLLVASATARMCTFDQTIFLQCY